MIESLQAFQNVFKIPELKRRILITVGLLVAYRIGADGLYEEAGRAEAGAVLTLTEPFPITIDPAALVR